jgi:quercetin dioxygenase-like cupin family protein
MGAVALFPYDIEPILRMLPELGPAWTEETWRQSLHFSPHRDSETIFLRRQPGNRPRDVLHQLASVCTMHHHGALANAIEAICRHVGGRPARAMLVKLNPGGRVAPHTDIGIYAQATERFHLPVITNPGAWMRWGSERYHFAPGTVFAFDKHVEHEAGNDGAEARLHLIVDVVPESADVLAG